MTEYVVPNMQLIWQDLDNACWHASLRMLLLWRNRFRDPFQADNPAYHQNLDRLHDRNRGMPWAQISQIARQLGLVPIPPLTSVPSAATIEGWLLRYGPLYVDGVAVNTAGMITGVGHVVVVAGVRTHSPVQVKIYDPWPPGQGDIRWVDTDQLVFMLSRHLGNPGTPVAILHLSG